MIITENVRISRILELTWRTDLLILISCLASFLADKLFFSKYFVLPAIIPTVIGTALAFFIGFNNNQAYARWWEARQIWGSLVNNSRSWARGILSYTDDDGVNSAETTRFQQLVIRRHIAFLYALKAALRNEKWNDYKEYLDEAEIQYIETKKNKHNAILGLQAQDLEKIYRQNKIDGFKFLHLNDLLVTFTDDMGKSERIKNTVFPTAYHSFTRIFISIFSVLITIVASETTGIWSVALGGMVSFVFQTTYVIGMSLLNPFEPEVSGIALDQITRTIEINLLEMLKEEPLPEPIKPVNNEYVM